MSVLVTNAKNRIAYNVVRSLGQKGISVCSADFISPAMANASRYSNNSFTYPSPFSQQDAFIECLIEKIVQLKIDVLIPVFEELFLVAKHKERLSKYVKMVVPNYSQILLAHNKEQWEPIADELNIPVPATFELEELASGKLPISTLPFPLLVKPKQGGGGWGIRQINTLDSLNDFMDLGSHMDLPFSRFIAQEKIDGEIYCVAMVFCDGAMKGKVTYKQIREYPSFSGQATCRISISNKTAENYFQKILERLDWHGVCQADFIVEAKTGIPYLIDINPRFWGSLTQGIASGVDFPYLIYQIARHGDVDPVDGFKEGVSTRWMGGDLRGFYRSCCISENKLSFLGDFFFPENKAMMFDDFSFKDPVPFFVWGSDSIYRLFKNRKSRPHESLSGIWD